MALDRHAAARRPAHRGRRRVAARRVCMLERRHRPLERRAESDLDRAQPCDHVRDRPVPGDCAGRFLRPGDPADREGVPPRRARGDCLRPWPEAVPRLARGRRVRPQPDGPAPAAAGTTRILERTRPVRRNGGADRARAGDGRQPHATGANRRPVRARPDAVGSRAHLLSRRPARACGRARRRNCAQR